MSLARGIIFFYVCYGCLDALGSNSHALPDRAVQFAEHPVRDLTVKILKRAVGNSQAPTCMVCPGRFRHIAKQLRQMGEVEDVQSPCAVRPLPTR
jgi:hypothetical protein